MTGNIVSFDIGSAQIKLVWCAGGVCKAAVSAPVPDGLVRGGTIVSMDAMADLLRQLAKENNLPRSAQAAVILPAPLVFTRITELPPMTEGQLTYNLPFEFKDYLNQEKSRYYFDYAVQGTEKDESGETTGLRLFACATLKKTVEDYRAMFYRAGYKLKLALPEEAAFGNLAALHAKNAPGDEDLCIVDIGHKGIRMFIYRDGHFRTHRAVDLGLWDLEQQLASERGVDPHMAHTHLLTDYESALTQDSTLELFNRMAVEIMKAVNFYNYNNREQSLRSVYLCGGGAAIAPLRENVSRVTDLELKDIGTLIPGDVETPWLFARAAGCGL